MEAEKIGETVVKRVPDMEEVKLSSVWTNQRTVIIFFRRFGCLFCRHSAKEISLIANVLSTNGVRLVGVGMDDIGLDDFITGGYFKGDIFLDNKRNTYKALGFKKFGYVGLVAGIFSKQQKEVYTKSRAMGLKMDFKGDGFQNGGALVVDSGGATVLLSFKQDNAADFVSNEEILKVLSIEKPPNKDDDEELQEQENKKLEN